MRLLTEGTANQKTAKGQGLYLRGRPIRSYILHLAPSDVSGFNTCQSSDAECRRYCLNTAGQGGMAKGMSAAVKNRDLDVADLLTFIRENGNAVQAARVRRTVMFFRDRPRFERDLRKDLNLVVKRAHRDGHSPVVRLNGTSDLPWERIFPWVFADYPEVTFYDYTKVASRLTDLITGGAVGGWILPNYHLTFSRGADNEEQAVDVLRAGGVVAVVAWSQEIGQWWAMSAAARHVADGDEHDFPFLRLPGTVVVLKAKGNLRGQSSMFVIGSAD